MTSVGRLYFLNAHLEFDRSGTDRLGRAWGTCPNLTGEEKSTHRVWFFRTLDHEQISFSPTDARRLAFSVSHQKSSLARRMRTNPEKSFPHATVNFSLKRKCQLLQVSGTTYLQTIIVGRHNAATSLAPVAARELSTAVVIIPPNHLAPMLSFVGPDASRFKRESIVSANDKAISNRALQLPNDPSSHLNGLKAIISVAKLRYTDIHARPCSANYRFLCQWRLLAA